MTNGVIWAVVITGKYAVRSSPREKRNITPFSARMPSFIFFFLPGPRGHHVNVLPAFVINTPKDVSFLESSHTLSLPSLEGPHLQLQCLHLRVQLCEPLLDMTKAVDFGTKGLVPYAHQGIVDSGHVHIVKA